MIGKIWNYLSKPEVVPRIFALFLAIFLLFGFFNHYYKIPNQLYPKPKPHSQILKTPLAPYDRNIVKAQYPNYLKNLGKITSYLTPIAEFIKDKTYFFGTTIVSTPGGILDEILYYTRGMDTVLESTVLLISFMIFSWMFFHRR
ncbi:(NiFe)-hydrogenase-3-type complex Eha, membrane protein EhaF [Methanocaldococcus villosus KIN24-T80]|uniref:(NiFe)-hydrogenase-3-type complex Eha, membrane protein EhaF n=1 Tax=Methanocaldococcus villosus KIN24-T80 TaxID=1069083 RepID=N6V3C5_9EURY|nr:EhaF family protein [Methanocaldococcus villosus]ENN96763.1 (NiFe)-hydrogenase-3-type complex Eha, membrane protein EhaF [Methanocaldococcus villosus KIN24-T80]